jgi:hypothetical protein
MNLYRFLSLYDEITNVLFVSILSHYRYKYDSLILYKQTWAILIHWCQGNWYGGEVTKECLETNFHLSSTLLRKLCFHYANGFDNVESVYVFCSNPV